MRVAYADPPYIGQSKKHYGDHPDYAGEVDHRELFESFHDYDGWLLHASSPSLPHILDCAYGANWTMQDFRIMAWLKPFAAFKKNVSVAYAWEPVLVKACRKPVVSKRTLVRGEPFVFRDVCAESITLKKGLVGAKPENMCRWAFEMLGMEPGDDLVDLFPGSGAVTAAWTQWCEDVAA